MLFRNKKLAMAVLVSCFVSYFLGTRQSRQAVCFVASQVNDQPRLLDGNMDGRRMEMQRNISTASHCANASLNVLNVGAVLPHATVAPVQTTSVFRSLTYAQALQHVTAKQPPGNKLVLLALIDGGVLDMALNFYITCIKPYSIENYLLLATDQQTCDRVLALDMHCHMYREDNDATSASRYFSKAFLRKMNIRTDMILDALILGYRVLHSDVDMFCAKHPIDHIDCKMGTCDIAPLQDNKLKHNAGFLLINPTDGSKKVYKRMQAITRRFTRMDDQTQLNMAIEEMRNDTRFHVSKLDTKKFLCGKYYYEDKKRFFATDDNVPCPDCVVIHNNWIVGMEAKVYRAKELHQWMYDGDDEYFTSSTRKYLAYDNPIIPAGNTSDTVIHAIELEALRSALGVGRILNRTVILPKFHCSKQTCPLNSLIMITPFDREFGSQYREHSFLAHPLVPQSVAQSEIGPFLIESKYVVEKMNVENVMAFEPMYPEKGMNEREILLHFNDVSHSVVRFFAMYGAFDTFLNDSHHKLFMEGVAKGMVKGRYRQI